MDTLSSMEAAPADQSLAAEPCMDPPPAIGSNERRMHVHAYNYWASLLKGRALPVIGDIDPATIGDFGLHGVLLDFSGNPRDPAIAWLGRALAEEGGHADTVATLADVPERSLLVRLSDHYADVVANRAPIGFEAEFDNIRGNHTLYRGILMPFSSDTRTVDFIYGVINWKEAADAALVAGIEAEVGNAAPPAPRVTAAAPAWADGPSRPSVRTAAPSPDTADRLAAAMAGADLARSTGQRARSALFRALGLAYDLVLADAAIGGDGPAPSARQTRRIADVVGQLFGTESRRRRADYAAVLAYGLRTQTGHGALRMVLEREAGGICAIARAERRARRDGGRSH